MNSEHPKLQSYILSTVSYLKKWPIAVEDKMKAVIEEIDKATATDWKETCKHLLRMKIINSDSMFGITLLAFHRSESHTTPATPACVIKTASQTSENYTFRYEFDILHEVLIGYNLNNLHQTNVFAKMYGYIFKKRHALNFQQYIHGKTLMEILKDLPDGHMKVVKDVFLQLAHGLYLAQKEYGFMHWDLHGENVLIEKLDHPIDLHLRFTEDLIVKLEDVFYVPKIIDYGVSTMTCPQFISNKYAAVEEDEKQDVVLWLATSEKTSVLPLFDLYRYITYVFLKWNQPSLDQYLTYLFQLSKKTHIDEQLKANFVLLQQGRWREYKKMYIYQKLSLPKKENGTHGAIFKEGNLVDWVKSIL